MKSVQQILNHALAALLVTIAAAWGGLATGGAGIAHAQDSPASSSDQPARQADIEAMLRDLARPDNDGWRRIERQILGEWSKSGSASADLLLQRGREAIREARYDVAIEHLTALTDHAPDFAEGWNARATAYFHAGYHGPAMDDIARALTLNPKHFAALAGLGTILADAGFKETALSAYEAALAIHPHIERIRRAAERLRAEVGGQTI